MTTATLKRKQPGGDGVDRPWSLKRARPVAPCHLREPRFGGGRDRRQREIYWLVSSPRLVGATLRIQDSLQEGRSRIADEQGGA